MNIIGGSFESFRSFRRDESIENERHRRKGSDTREVSGLGQVVDRTNCIRNYDGENKYL